MEQENKVLTVTFLVGQHYFEGNYFDDSLKIDFSFGNKKSEIFHFKNPRFGLVLFLTKLLLDEEFKKKLKGHSTTNLSILNLQLPFDNKSLPVLIKIFKQIEILSKD